MLVLRSEDHLVRWLAQRDLERGATMSLEQCWAIAHAWYAGKLRPDWRRHTPEEAGAVFAAAGLTGPFWRLPGAPAA
jgi:hypothetical protein